MTEDELKHAVEHFVAQRVKQGLPPHLDDPVSVAIVAAVLDEHERSEKARRDRT